MVPLLKDEFGFTDAQVKEVESYHHHPKAQAAAILQNMFHSGSKTVTISSLLQNLPGQNDELLSQLIEGMLF